MEEWEIMDVPDNVTDEEDYADSGDSMEEDDLLPSVSTSVSVGTAFILQL